MESARISCCNDRMENYRAFAPVTVLTSMPGMMVEIGTAYDAAKFILEEWPADEDGPKLDTCKEILWKCLAGECSPAVARVAFVEAAREAGIFIDTTPRQPPTGKLGQRWGKRKPARGA